MVVRGMILAHSFPVAITTSTVAFNQDIKALVVSQSFTPEFLLYWLQATAGDVLKIVDVANHGTKRLPTEMLFALPVPTPPLGEQRKIAAILASVDDAIEATQAVLDQLAVVKRAMMADLLTRGIPGRHTRFKQTEIGEVPERWEVLRVDELGAIQLGKMRSPVHTKGRMRPYLRVANVLDDAISTESIFEMLFEDSEWGKFGLRVGDVLLNEGQSLELVGRSAIYRGVPENCAFQKTLLRFRAGQDVLSEFMQAQFQLTLYSGRFAEHAVKTTSIAHLTGVRFAAMLMVKPPLDEQQEIADALGAFAHREASERDALAALTATKSALAAALLSGEVRVTPDTEAP
jgi:type I restriction enzyme S subunit